MSDADRIGELRDEWLDAADEDLRTARQLLSTPAYEIYRIPSFLAQQATEKALKGVLTHLQLDYPRTHDLERLQTLVPPDWEQVRSCEGLDALTRHAVEARYPDDFGERVSVEEAEIALDRAQALIGAVHHDFALHGVVVRNRRDTAK